MPFAEVDGVRLHYLDSGRAAGSQPPLVLLHGFPLHAGMWAPQIEAFSAERRVIAPDLPGFGRSDAPDSMYRYTMPGFAELVAGLLDRLRLPTVVLGGLSMGGYVAFAFLREHGDRVAGLILADTLAGADTTAVFERRTDQQDQVARIGTAALIETLLDGLLRAATFSDRPELVERVRGLMANSPAGFIGALEAMKHRADSTGDLNRIAVPTLVVVGEDDALSPPEAARGLHAAIAGAELAVLPQAGHLSSIEAADAFNRAVSSFLARV